MNTSRELGEVERLIGDVVCTLTESYDSGLRSWPYEVRQEKPEPQAPEGEAPTVDEPEKKHYSLSTTSMILLALVRATGCLTTPVVRFPPTDLESGDATSKVIRGASKGLVDALTSGDFQTDSSTYGKNDPLTLGWLSELASLPWQDGPLKTAWESLRKTIAGHLKLPGKLDDPSNLFTPIADHDVLSNAFPALRCIHACKAVCGDDFIWRGEVGRKWYEFFESRVHEHLSYSEIPDSRFDPAELAFCLEGMVQTQPEVLDDSIVKRVIGVLENEQRLTHSGDR